MNKWLGLVVMLLVVSGCQREQDSRVDGEAGTGQSVDLESHSDWLMDYDKALAKAKAENKYILIDFSGSDWCGWCIKLDREVFSTKPFKEYAKDNLVLMLADFPRDTSKQSDEVKKQNNQLKDEFNIRGFPTVFILDPNGKTIAKTGYQDGGPEAYVEHIKNLIAEAK